MRLLLLLLAIVFNAQALPALCDAATTWRIANRDYVYESRGRILLVAFMPLQCTHCNAQLAKLQWVAESLREVKILVVGRRDEDTRFVEHFRRQFPLVDIELESEREPVWNTLAAFTHDHFIYDRCGRLANVVRHPRSDMSRFEDTVNALKSALTYANCGWCQYEGRSTTTPQISAYLRPPPKAQSRSGGDSQTSNLASQRNSQVSQRQPSYTRQPQYPSSRRVDASDAQQAVGRTQDGRVDPWQSYRREGGATAEEQHSVARNREGSATQGSVSFDASAARTAQRQQQESGWQQRQPPSGRPTYTDRTPTGTPRDTDYRAQQQHGRVTGDPRGAWGERDGGSRGSLSGTLESQSFPHPPNAAESPAGRYPPSPPHTEQQARRTPTQMHLTQPFYGRVREESDARAAETRPVTTREPFSITTGYGTSAHLKTPPLYDSSENEEYDDLDNFQQVTEAPVQNQIVGTQAPTVWPTPFTFDSVPCAAFTDQLCYQQAKKRENNERLNKCCDKGVYLTDVCVPGRCSNATSQLCCIQKFIQSRYMCCENSTLNVTEAGDSFSRCCYNHFVLSKDSCCPFSLARFHWTSASELCLPNVRVDLSSVRITTETQGVPGVTLDLGEDRSWDHECRYGGAAVQFAYVPDDDDLDHGDSHEVRR